MDGVLAPNAIGIGARSCLPQRPAPGDFPARSASACCATGARYILTLPTELRERNARCGAVGVCRGSGQGVALVLENTQAS
jgi:hypothetical protein